MNLEFQPIGLLQGNVVCIDVCICIIMLVSYSYIGGFNLLIRFVIGLTT